MPTERTQAQCEAQHRNFSLFLVKGSIGHMSYLSKDVSPLLLNDLRELYEQIVKDLEAKSHVKA